MRSEKARGFVLDFADVEALNNELEPADAMAVIVALSRYAKEGRRPEKGELCPAASMAFTLMVRNVDRGLENLKKTHGKHAQCCKCTLASTKCGWKANVCRWMRTHANARNGSIKHANGFGRLRMHPYRIR